MNFLFTKTPLLFFSQSFWRDEAFSYLLAKKNIFDIFVTTARDFNPPLYYLLLHFWMKIAGTSEIALRSLSLLFFCATIYVADHILLDVLKIKHKWRMLYLLLFLINPFLNYYAFEARMYTMLAFFATLSFYAFFQKKRKLYLIATVLGLYTHYFMVFVVASQFVYLKITRNYTRKSSQNVKKWFFTVGAWFAPWLVFLLFNHPPIGGDFWIPKPTFNEWINTPAILATGYEQELGFIKVSLFPLSLLLYGVLFMVWKNYKKQNVEQKSIDLYLLLWTFLPAIVTLVLSFWKPLFLPRYFIFTTVGLTVLFIKVVEENRAIIKIVAIVLFALFLLQYNTTQIANRRKDNLRNIISIIAGEMKPNDVLYVDDELNFHPAEYYFDANRVFIYRKTYDEIPAYVGKVLIPQNKVISTLPLFPKKAFILHDNMTYDIQSSF